VLPGVGHSPWVEAQEAFMHAIGAAAAMPAAGLRPARAGA
jgi:hypothetical protein